MTDETSAAGVPPPQQMFDLVTGYWRAQAVGTAAALGFADALANTPRSAAEVAGTCRTEERATARLLSALAMLGVVRRVEADRFALTPLGETLLSDVPGSMRQFVIAQTAPGHWLPWGRMPEVLRTGQSKAKDALGGMELWEYYAVNQAEGEAFSGAMTNMTGFVAAELVNANVIPTGTTIVDVGGAHGQLLAAALDADPTARGILFDLPEVSSVAKAALRARGLIDRTEVVGGSFFETMPTGDVYLIKHILHDWNDEQSVRILANVRRAMAANGKVILIEMVLPDDDSPSVARMMDLNMLVMLPGRERTAAEYSRLLADAGLKMTVVRPTHSPFSLVEAVAG